MKIRIILPYLLLFLVSLAAFLFFLFPGPQMAEKVSRVLSVPAAGLDVHVRNAVPSVFMKFHCSEPRIQYQDFSVMPGALDVSPSLGLFSFKNSPVRFAVSAWSGKIDGRITRKAGSTDQVSGIDLNLENILIREFVYEPAGTRIQMDADLNGEYQYQQPAAGPPKPEGAAPKPPGSKTGGKPGSGSGELVLSGVAFKIKNSFFSQIKLEEIPFSEIRIKFSQAKNLVNIESLEARGPMLHIQMKGALTVNAPFSETRLVFSGTIMPDSPYLASFANSAYIKARAHNIKTRGLAFKIGGTFRQPEIKL